MQNLVSRVPLMVLEGNHEIEEQAQNQTFAAYSSRFAFPSEESGSSSTFYYSFNAGGIHFVMLGAYIAYDTSGRPLLSSSFSFFCCCCKKSSRVYLNYLRNKIGKSVISIWVFIDWSEFVFRIQRTNTSGWSEIWRMWTDQRPRGLWLLGIHRGTPLIKLITERPSVWELRWKNYFTLMALTLYSMDM